MYALINTMNSTSDTIGTILSSHRTVGAAEKADGKIQRMTKRANGQNSYLPTQVVKLTKKPRGRFVTSDDWRPIEPDEE